MELAVGLNECFLPHSEGVKREEQEQKVGIMREEQEQT
jgi:hypothetical protein